MNGIVVEFTKRRNRKYNLHYQVIVLTMEMYIDIILLALANEEC